MSSRRTAISCPAAFVLLMILLSEFVQNTGAQTAAARTQYFPNTTEGIHLEMVFNYNVTNPGIEAGIVDMVWGSNWATQPPAVYNTSYIPYSVDNYTHSIAWYTANHPDWLEYLCDRKTLAFEFGATTLAPLNFAIPEVQGYQWSLWVDAPLAQGFGGIAVDTMDLTNDWARCGHYDISGSWVQQYTGQSDDPAFRHDVLAWEAATYTHTHAYSDTATMQVNVSYHFGVSNADNLQLMTTTDMVLDERGFTNWGNAALHVTPGPEWEGIVKALRYVESKGLCYMTNGEEPGPTENISQADREWVLANYLLIKNDCTYVYMTGITAGAQDYGYLFVFPEYSIPIGHPTSAMRKTQGVWARTFSGGLAMVNPYATSATVALPPGNYVDVNGNPVTSPVIIERQTGIILLSTQ